MYTKKEISQIIDRMAAYTFKIYYRGERDRKSIFAIRQHQFTFRITKRELLLGNIINYKINKIPSNNKIATILFNRLENDKNNMFYDLRCETNASLYTSKYAYMKTDNLQNILTAIDSFLKAEAMRNL